MALGAVNSQRTSAVYVRSQSDMTATDISPTLLADLPEELRSILASPEKVAKLRSLLAPKSQRKLVSASQVPSFPFADLPGYVAKLLSGKRPSPAASLRDYTWQTEIREHLKASGLPERFWFEVERWHPKQKKVFDACKSRLTGVGAIIALVGPRGTGKTTIAAQLVIDRAWDESRAIPCHRRPPYRKLVSLVSKLKPVYSDFGSIQAEELRRYMQDFCKLHPLVILDETGECEDMRCKDRLLTDILDRRYSHRNDTVLISNQTFESFTQTVNPSTLSRLEEHGEIIVCDWPSFRSKPALKPFAVHESKVA